MFELLLETILNGLLNGGIYALLASGLSLAMGFTGVVNLAHGEFMMIGMYVTFWLFTLFGLNPFITIVISVPILFIIGMALQRALFNPALKLKLLEEEKMIIIGLIAISLMFILQNLAHLVWTAEYRTIIIGLTGTSLYVFGIRISTLNLYAFLISVCTLVTLHLFMKRSKWGKSIRAIAQDEEASMALGINVPRVRVIVFGLSISLAGLAGSLLAMLFYIHPAVGAHLTFYALVVAILGGIGNVGGALIGGLILGSADALSAAYIAPAYKEGIAFIILVLMLTLKPSGLLGERA